MVFVWCLCGVCVVCVVFVWCWCTVTSMVSRYLYRALDIVWCLCGVCVVFV